MNGKLLIAMPKGRLYDPAAALLGRAGVVIANKGTQSRVLVLEDSEHRYQFVTLKPIDIPVYVESGVIDAGIVGTDILRELESDVNEPLDLQIGKCRLSVAAPDGRAVSYQQNISVATKYPHTASKFFATRNAHVHIVRLEGSENLLAV